MTIVYAVSCSYWYSDLSPPARPSLSSLTPALLTSLLLPIFSPSAFLPPPSPSSPTPSTHFHRYYFPNSTGALVAGETLFEAPKMATLIHVHGSQNTPVKDIGFNGLTFKHSEPTYMRQYYIPSCG